MHSIRLTLVVYVLVSTLGLTLGSSPAVQAGEITSARSARTELLAPNAPPWTICHPFVDLGPWRLNIQINLYYQTMLVQITGCGGANIAMHEEYVVIGDHGSTELTRQRWPGWGEKYCTNANSCTVKASHDQFLTPAEYARMTYSCVTGTFFVTRASTVGGPPYVCASTHPT